MDSRCGKFWDDGQELLRQAGSNAERALGKMLKECRTMSRFLQKNQSSRFSDPAQQKLVDAMGCYVTFAKAQGDAQLLDAIFQVVKDALAMPFNVMGSKQKKRAFKWYNELIGLVGGDPDAALLNGETAPAPRIEWSVLGIDDDGYLSLLSEESGETCETVQVPKKSKEFKDIRKALDSAEVTVVTVDQEIVEVRIVADE